MKNNTIAKIGLYLILIFLVIPAIYFSYSYNPITFEDFNLFYPFFFLVLYIKHYNKQNENTNPNRKWGFKKLRHNVKF